MSVWRSGAETDTPEKRDAFIKALERAPAFPTVNGVKSRGLTRLEYPAAQALAGRLASDPSASEAGAAASAVEAAREVIMVLFNEGHYENRTISSRGSDYA